MANPSDLSRVPRRRESSRRTASRSRGTRLRRLDTTRDVDGPLMQSRSSSTLGSGSSPEPSAPSWGSSVGKSTTNSSSSSRSTLSRLSKPAKVEDSQRELERHYGMNWKPAASSQEAIAPMPSRSLPSRQAKRVPADNLCTWFDWGLNTSKDYVSGVVPLPGEYAGAAKRCTLISQKEVDMKMWPVRLDIGVAEPSGNLVGKTLAVRTLYHFTHAKSFQKFVQIFSQKQHVAQQVLDLIQEDYSSRAKFDGLELKTDFALCPVEPADLDSRTDMYFNTLGTHVPVGHIEEQLQYGQEQQDPDRPFLRDCCNFAIAIRVPAGACTDLDISGRELARVDYKVLAELLQQEYATREKTSVLKRAKHVDVSDKEEVSPYSLSVAESLRRCIPALDFWKQDYSDELAADVLKKNMGISVYRPNGQRKLAVELNCEKENALEKMEAKIGAEKRKKGEIESKPIFDVPTWLWGRQANKLDVLKYLPGVSFSSTGVGHRAEVKITAKLPLASA